MTEKQKIFTGTGGIKPMDKYIYRAKLDRVVDGDTIDALIDVGFDIWVKKRIRFMGLDTWECRTRNLEEKKLGLAARPLFFSSRSLVLDSQVSKPIKRILFLNHMSKPTSIKASTVSPSTTLSNFAL